MNQYHCVRCSKVVPLDQARISHRGLAKGCLAGLALGAATKNPLAAIGLMLVGALVGHLIDETIGRECPLCGEVLKLIVGRSFGI